MTKDEIIRLAKEAGLQPIFDLPADWTLELDRFYTLAIDHKTSVLAKQVQELRAALKLVADKPRSHESVRVAVQTLTQTDTLATEVMREHDRALVEKCAKVCESGRLQEVIIESSTAYNVAVRHCAAAIRALAAEAGKEDVNGAS